MEPARVLVRCGLDDGLLARDAAAFDGRRVVVVVDDARLDALEPRVLEQVEDGVAGGYRRVGEPPGNAGRVAALEVPGQVVLRAWPRAVVAADAEAAVVQTLKVVVRGTVIAEAAVEAARLHEGDVVVDECHEDDAQAVAVESARVVGLLQLRVVVLLAVVVHHLRRGVGRRANHTGALLHRASKVVRVLVVPVRDTEVRQLAHAVRRQQHVLRLDVAVRDSLVVTELHPARHLLEDAELLRQGHVTPSGPLNHREQVAQAQLHDKPPAARGVHGGGHFDQQEGVGDVHVAAQLLRDDELLRAPLVELLRRLVVDHVQLLEGKHVLLAELGPDLADFARAAPPDCFVLVVEHEVVGHLHADLLHGVG